MTSKIPDSLRRAWHSTPAADDEPDAADLPARGARRQAGARDGMKAKGKATGRRHADRFATLNAFTDFTAATLNRGELLTWLVLYRDTRDGTAATSQADIARRAGVNVRTVKRAVLSLCRQGLLTVVFRGNLRRGPSVYRVRALEPTARK